MTAPRMAPSRMAPSAITTSATTTSNGAAPQTAASHGAATRPPAIDRSFYAVDLSRYYRDFALDFGGFCVGFAWLVTAESLAAQMAAYVVATVAIHRACIFGHDVVHRYKDPRMRRFRLLFDFTVGAVSLAPVLRFYRPHLTHHAIGQFRTAMDPQYLLMRGNPGMTGLVLVVAPLLMPLWSLLQVIVASLGGAAGERMTERLFDRAGLNTANTVDPRHRAEIVARSRVYLALLIAFGVAVPTALPLLYLVIAGGWLLLALRVPLEHGLETMLDRRTDWHDQMIDSYTIESPLADILQPHGMKYHTAHHLYPAVPYHALPHLHEHLKCIHPPYRDSVVSLRDALRFGPARSRRAPS